MPDIHSKFHSVNGKRLVLVVDDEFINREIVKVNLEDKYEVITAGNGMEALELMRTYKETLSLVLLDLMMPVMSGQELLRHIHGDEELERIPVIVLTSDQASEVECLKLGAMDFIPKPIPDPPHVMLARIERIIQLGEDTNTIRQTERDPLTGLYNREYFFHYAEQYDHFHQNTEMDAIVLDINHFHMINERYGKAYGDVVLRRVGERVREMVRGAGGIVCRRTGDTFLVYCPHRAGYKDILENASVGLDSDGLTNNRVRVRMGVYPCVDKSIDMERRFGRAKSASDTVRGSFTKSIAFYSDELHQKELYRERLVEDFQKAIAEEQFIVYYQPKFDVRPEHPVLASAEALVRWKHPELGMISPGVFIPLFEENGLIRELDSYVWNKAAAQVRDWKERLGLSVPVSVNVSRIDMYDPGLVDKFRRILETCGLSTEEYRLEITESAYTEDSTQIIATVNQLRGLGFRIEMDDFGTGYSSLNMLSSLPIDALKLDMRFIAEAFRNGRDTRMIEVIIDIADYLSVPVIAEGVETEEQLQTLKALGCDYVQGYYFSKPLPAEDYETFLLAKREEEKANGERHPAEDVFRDFEGELPSVQAVLTALTSSCDELYYVDMKSGWYARLTVKSGDEQPCFACGGADFFADVNRMAETAVCQEDRGRVSQALCRENLLRQLAGERRFLMSYRLQRQDGAEPAYDFLQAVSAPAHDRRHAVIGISHVGSGAELADASSRESTALARIAQALSRDYAIVYDVDTYTDEFREYRAQGRDGSLTLVRTGVDFFEDFKHTIVDTVLQEDRSGALKAFAREHLLDSVRDGQTFSLSCRMLMDGNRCHANVKALYLPEDERHIVIGVSNIDAQIQRERELSIARDHANRDALTGVKSKHFYAETEAEVNRRIARGSAKPFSIVVCDVNDLRRINDTLGHTEGDEQIRRAAMVICNVFDHSPVFRYGGDEFVALLRDRDYEVRAELLEKLRDFNRQSLENGGVVVACGMSDFSSEQDSSVMDVFARADAAMYDDKLTLKRQAEAKRKETV